MIYLSLSEIGRILTEKLTTYNNKMPRLAFDVDAQFSQEFNELVKLTGASSKADAFRKAISLYKVITKAQEQGEKIMIADRDRQPISEIIIL